MVYEFQKVIVIQQNFLVFHLSLCRQTSQNGNVSFMRSIHNRYAMGRTDCDGDGDRDRDYRDQSDLLSLSTIQTLLSECYVNRHKFVLSFLTDIEDIDNNYNQHS